MSSTLILFIIAGVILFLTRLYLVLPNRTKLVKKQNRTKPCKTSIFLGSGKSYKKKTKKKVTEKLKNT